MEGTIEWTIKKCVKSTDPIRVWKWKNGTRFKILLIGKEERKVMMIHSHYLVKEDKEKYKILKEVIKELSIPIEKRFLWHINKKFDETDDKIELNLVELSNEEINEPVNGPLIEPFFEPL